MGIRHKLGLAAFYSVSAVLSLMTIRCFAGPLWAEPPRAAVHTLRLSPEALATEVSGNISSNTTWSKVNSPYLVTENITVDPGVVLTIEPGVVIKFNAQRQLRLENNAQLLAIGTTAEPIVFTSYRDDTHGGDTNGDGQATLPVAGDWYYLWGSGIGSTLHLEHTLVRYHVYGVYANATLTVRDSTLEESTNAAIYVSPQANTTPTITLERNLLRKSNFAGLELRGQPGTLTVRSNTLEQFQTGAFLYNLTAAQIEDNSFTFANLNGTALYLENVGSGVNISNNTISHTGAASSRPGLELKNSQPQLTNNRVQGFEEAVLINDGYPQIVPTYSGNDFSGNGLSGIAVTGQLLAGSWSKIGGYPHFIHGGATVANGATFTFNPGDVVKFQQGWIQLGTGAVLRAVGTADNPIVFTSIKDDSYAGDSNNDGQATLPEPGDWYYLWGNGQAATLHLQNVLVRYASQGAIYASSNLELRASTVEHSNGTGIYVAPLADTTPQVLVAAVSLRNNGNWGIEVHGQPGTLQLVNNTLQDNRQGIYLGKLSSGQVTSNTLTFSSDNSVGIAAEEAGAAVTVANNSITAHQQPPSGTGITVKESVLALTRNRVQGFARAVEITGGYPQQVPTYTANDFANNQVRGIVVSGEINSGTWQDVGGYPHFLAGYTLIANGATLTIPPGSVIKLLAAAQLNLGTGAKLQAVGTVEQPIIFTSIKDDEYLGDSNNDGQATLPEPGSWSTIAGNSAAATLNLQHVWVRFGAYALQANANLTLQDSIIEQSSNVALTIAATPQPAPTVTIERSLLRDNYVAVQISKLPSAFTLTGNALINNQIAVESQSSTASVNAPGNWWGAATGPTVDGQSNGVSANVNFANWLTSEPAFVPIERAKPPANTPSGAPDKYEADNSCGQAAVLSSDGLFQEHTFHAQGDADWTQFTASAGATYRIEVQPVDNSLADVNLELYTQCDTAPADSWQANFTPGVRLDFTAAQAGPIYVKVNNYDANVYGADTAYRVSVRPLQSTATPKGAVIILAGRLKGVDRLQANIHHITNNVYELFKASGYSDDNIYYLANDSTLTGRDDDATLAKLQAALTSWAVGKVGATQPLILYLMDHGDVDRFYVDGLSQQELTPAQLNEWLNQLETAAPGVKITMVLEACYSGSFIDGDQRISQANRLVITSTSAQTVAYASNKGAQFSDRFLTSLREGYGFANSFWDAQYSVRRLNKLQEPWIDANGNGVPNETADGADANAHDASNQQPADLWAPFIVTAQGPTAIIDDKGLLRAEVRDNKAVKRVWATIYPPDYTAPTSVTELVAEDVPTLELAALGNHQFSAEYNQFSADGLYRIALYAEDNDGLKAKLTVLEVRKGVNPGALFLPLVRR